MECWHIYCWIYFWRILDTSFLCYFYLAALDWDMVNMISVSVSSESWWLLIYCPAWISVALAYNTCFIVITIVEMIWFKWSSPGTRFIWGCLLGEDLESPPGVGVPSDVVLFTIFSWVKKSNGMVITVVERDWGSRSSSTSFRNLYTICWYWVQSRIFFEWIIPITL